MSTIEEIKKDIDLINSFSSDFYSKNNNVILKIGTIVSKLDAIIAEEQQNERYLKNLQSKVSNDELNNTLKSFLKLREDIEKKSNDYNYLIENNKKLISEISTSIKNNDVLVQNINQTVKNIEETTFNIESKLNK